MAVSILLVIGGIVLVVGSGRISTCVEELPTNQRVMAAFGGREGGRFFNRGVLTIIGVAWLYLGVADLVTR